jgi:hypothetical protein
MLRELWMLTSLGFAVPIFLQGISFQMSHWEEQRGGTSREDKKGKKIKNLTSLQDSAPLV